MNETERELCCQSKTKNQRKAKLKLTIFSLLFPTAVSLPGTPLFSIMFPSHLSRLKTQNAIISKHTDQILR